MTLTAPPQTRPPREAHRLDESALARWLGEHVEGCRGGTAKVQQFKGGQSNPTYWVGVEGGAGGDLELVVRKKPPGELLPSAHAVEREYRIMRALDGTGVPVPKTLGLCEDASVAGTPFFVMRFVSGRIFWDPTLPELATNEERAMLYREYIGALAKLHGVDYAKVGLAD
ncbi:MAG TPA: phosphotransferase family protein, partial [Labilithrix sp.]|nr:phosphotransferase family protein [Labilithrix sp.]